MHISFATERPSKCAPQIAVDGGDAARTAIYDMVPVRIYLLACPAEAHEEISMRPPPRFALRRGSLRVDRERRLASPAGMMAYSTSRTTRSVYAEPRCIRS